MKVYLCRWPNGDCSVVKAQNKAHAVDLLDEEGGADVCMLTELDDFMAHFQVNEKAFELQHFPFELQHFGTTTYDAIMDRAYPLMEEARRQVLENKLTEVENRFTEEEAQALFHAAVQEEKTRLRLELDSPRQGDEDAKLYGWPELKGNNEDV